MAGNQTKMLTCNPTSFFKTYQNLKSHDSKPKFSKLPNSRNKKERERERVTDREKHYIKIMLESKDPAIKLFGMKIPLSSTVFEAEEDELSAEQVLILALLVVTEMNLEEKRFWYFAGHEKYSFILII